MIETGKRANQFLKFSKKRKKKKEKTRNGKRSQD